MSSTRQSLALPAAMGSSVRRLSTLLAVSYPLLAHATILLDSSMLLYVSVLVLVAATLLPSMATGSTRAWLVALAVVATLMWLHRIDAAVVALYLPPVAINAYLAWLFGKTLVAKRTPLIVRLVELLHGPEERLDGSIVRYASRLTLIWTVLFVSLALVNLSLALLARPSGLLISAGFEPAVVVPREIWSLFANVLNYAIVASFFMVEYAYRWRRFPQQPYRGLMDFLQRAGAAIPTLIGEYRSGAAPD